MQSQAAGKDKKEKKEKKEKNAPRRSTSAGKAVSAVGKFFQAARGSRTSIVEEKPSDDAVTNEATNRVRGSLTSENSAQRSVRTSGSSVQPEGSLFSTIASDGTEGDRTDASKQGRPVAVPSGATTSVEPIAKHITQVTAMLTKQGNGRSSSKGSSARLTAAQPVEVFLAHGLLPVPSGGLLQVKADETIGSVVEKLYRWRLFSCIVTFGDDKKEFFDCMDLACFMLEVVAGSGRVTDESEEDWSESKLKLQRVAEAQVQEALKAPRGISEFKRFDAEGSFLDLVVLLASHKRVPIYRHGELCRVTTAADILEMCSCVSEETAACLEGTNLVEMMENWPGMLSRIKVQEDFGMLEVLQTILDANVSAVPVVEGFRARSKLSVEPDSGKSPSNVSRMSKSSFDSEDSNIVARTLVGQFDIAALRVMLVHNVNDAGSWWWEDESLNKNILFEPCMDFISLSSAVVVSQSVSAPFFLIHAEETLARTISRLLTSTYHNVVVFPSGGNEGDVGDVQSLDGILSSIALVVAMMQAGLFDVLSWDPSKPRCDSAELPGGKRPRSKKTSLTKFSLPDHVVNQVTDEAEGGRTTKVKFCSVVELECLDVPTCPEHGIRHLKFTAVQDGEGKYAMDFRTLRDLNDGSKVGGAIAQCNACMKSLGRVTLRRQPHQFPALSMPASAKTSGEDSGSWFDVFFSRNSPSSSSASIRPHISGVSSPSTSARSALKRGTAPLKKSKTAERLVAIRDKQLENNSDSQPSRGSSIFGMCCSPCRMQSEKDQIHASMRIVGGVECPRENSDTFRGADDSPLVAKNSGRNSGASSDRGGRNSRRESKEGTDKVRDAKDTSLRKISSDSTPSSSASNAKKR